MGKLIAGDLGHGWAKFYDGTERYKFESMLGEVQGTLMGGSHAQIETEAGHWLVGKSARIQSRNKMTGSDESWSLSDQYKALMLYGISRFVPTDQKQITVQLVSTLAIRDYKRNRTNVLEKLLGEHRVTVDDQRDLKIIISDFRVLPQGFAPASQYVAPGLLNVVTDLGTRNINYSTFDGQDIVFPKTNSAETGALIILQNVAQRIADEFGIEYHPIDLIERNILQRGGVNINGKYRNLLSIIEQEISQYFEAYKALVSNVWREDLPKIDNLIVFGGGDYLIGEKIAEHFPQVVRLPNPQWTQVDSVYHYMAT